MLFIPSSVNNIVTFDCYSQSNFPKSAMIFMGRIQNQPESDMSRVVWARYDDGTDSIVLYKGTEVECIRIVEQLKEKLKAVELQPWEN